MIIFPDTEFKDFVRPYLISLALVSEDRREFYAERTAYRRDACSDFVRKTVLPLLGRVPGAACSRSIGVTRPAAWLAGGNVGRPSLWAMQDHVWSTGKTRFRAAGCKSPSGRRISYQKDDFRL